MIIDLTKKQFEALIKAVDAGSSIYGILGDTVSEDYKKQSNEIEELEKYLLRFATDFGLQEIVDDFMGELIVADDYSEKLQEVIDDYDDETFWSELETRLGKRDFERTMTDAEKVEMEENNGWYTDRIFELYEKWRKEFEGYGINRLKVESDK